MTGSEIYFLQFAELLFAIFDHRNYDQLINHKHNGLKGELKMAEEKFLTLHPLNKSGKNIDLDKYEAIKAAIIEALQLQSLNHTALTSEVIQALTGKFEGNISWYTETVKLDLEVRGLITRTASRPQQYKLA